MKLYFLKLQLLFHTVKYLKLKQIYFRLYYFARARYRKIIGFKYKFLKGSNSTPLELDKSIGNIYSQCINKEFSFLNLSKKFNNDINWNYSKYGKLWTYNLTYFEYLKNKEAVSLIYDFCENIENIKDGLEPFPISLRGINWIKFLTKYEIQDQKINDSLYAQYYILLDNLEYHLLGNHLLENGFSLLFGAYYFQDEKIYQKAKEILVSELDEQILADGAHFELSPMYHQIMLFRVLDCINLMKNNNYKNQELLEFLILKAEIMLGWLESITYKNGNIPLLNDSANKIAPTTQQLTRYAKLLNVECLMLNVEFKESGYHKITKENYECIVDIGKIGPDYIPGHAHADTFNYELNINNKPFIVDTGLSTYETNDRRTCERSTCAHNTVEVNGISSSEVWAGFRVANRAKIVDIEEKEDFIKASHDGYKNKYGILHTRTWKFEDNKIMINDEISKECQAVAMLHFHPDITKEQILSKIMTDRELNFIEYFYSSEFNTQIKAIALEIKFNKNLKVEINI
jgi:hypothetical protein